MREEQISTLRSWFETGASLHAYINSFLYRNTSFYQVSLFLEFASLPILQARRRVVLPVPQIPSRCQHTATASTPIHFVSRIPWITIAVSPLQGR